jgi:hypothetical protein
MIMSDPQGRPTKKVKVYDRPASADKPPVARIAILLLIILIAALIVILKVKHRI